MKKYLLTGVLIWVPLIITLWVLSLIVRAMDQSLLLLPKMLQPESFFGFYIPGLGMLLTLLVLFLTGLVATNIAGQKLVQFWESVLARIPIFNSIYYSVKQVSDTLFSSNSPAFKKVLLVRYPHTEAWSLAFQTGHPAQDVADLLPDEYVGVFIPTTPSPVNGFFFFVKKSAVMEVDMSIDDALKYIVSMGVVAPALRNPSGRAQNQ